MKKILFALLFFAIPSAAIAGNYSEQNLPANYIIWRGKVYNLNYLAGKGLAPTASAPQATQPTEQPTESREVRDNKQRVAYENARNLIQIERLQNMR